MSLKMIDPVTGVAYDEKHLLAILGEIKDERARQDEKWGIQHYPMGTGPDVEIFSGSHVSAAEARDEAQRECDADMSAACLTWMSILREEHYEGMAESAPEQLRAELIQEAAVLVAMVEDLDKGSR